LLLQTEFNNAFPSHKSSANAELTDAKAYIHRTDHYFAYLFDPFFPFFSTPPQISDKPNSILHHHSLSPPSLSFRSSFLFFEIRLTLVACFMRMRSFAVGVLVSASLISLVSGAFNNAVPRTMFAGKCSESGTNLHMSVPTSLDTLASGLTSVLRLRNGITVDSNVKPNANVQLLKLFDVENSKECRQVRERITELDLVVEALIPAASNSRATLPSGAVTPTLVVAIDGEEKIISGATEITEFFNANFVSQAIESPADEEDKAGVPQELLDAYETVGSLVADLMRPGRGAKVSAAALSSTVPRPEKKLILYSYEGNQFCRLVREVMTELDLVYELRSAGKESPRRAELAQLTGGSSQCPYLIDPNTGTSMPESADIIRYIYKTYADWTPPNELLQWASNTILPLAKPIFSTLAPLQAGSSSEDSGKYEQELGDAIAEIDSETQSHPVVVYTYKLSPFSFETTALLDNLDIDYKEISLGQEWLPGLLAPNGAIKRAALLEMTGQSSLPHIFIGGQPIGGLFSGEPGLVPALEQGTLVDMVRKVSGGPKAVEAEKVEKVVTTKDAITKEEANLDSAGAFE
jgi:glutaredoxin